ncbi:MAG: response regulator transcription factor [Labilithrix sp.]|nr:response regulator transcription factor [Labilithrix sp.]
MASHVTVDQPSPCVLVIEDEDDLRKLVAFNLSAASMRVVPLDDLTWAESVARADRPEVLVIDRGLPRGDGLDLVRTLRASEHGREIGILVVSARGTEEDRVEGLAAGADDYLVKPFSVRELVARVRILVNMVSDRRRARESGRTGGVLTWRDIVIDTVGHRVIAGDHEIELRPAEFKILVALVEAGGAVLSRQKLLVTIWGDAAASTPRAIDVHVRRLRERLGEHGAVVETVLGAGYRCAAA